LQQLGDVEGGVFKRDNWRSRGGGSLRAAGLFDEISMSGPAFIDL